METFSALLALCAGNSSVTGEFPAQRPVTWSFDVFFDQRLNKQLSKQSWGWWFEVPSCPLWCRCNVYRHFRTSLGIWNGATRIHLPWRKIKDMHNLCSQCHNFWWPGDTWSQGISRHDLDLVFMMVKLAIFFMNTKATTRITLQDWL